jgi:hypothetical protein
LSFSCAWRIRKISEMKKKKGKRFFCPRRCRRLLIPSRSTELERRSIDFPFSFSFSRLIIVVVDKILDCHQRRQVLFFFPGQVVGGVTISQLEWGRGVKPTCWWRLSLLLIRQWMTGVGWPNAKHLSLCLRRCCLSG